MTKNNPISHYLLSDKILWLSSSLNMAEENLAIQLDFFEEETPYSFFGKELAQVKDGLRRTQKKVFSQHNDLTKDFLKLKQEVESMRSLMLKRIK